MYFVAAKWKLGDGDTPSITSVSKYSGVKKDGVDEVDAIKGTRFEKDAAGIKVYEILALRTGLDLNSNFVVDVDDEEIAREAILELLSD